MLECADPFGGPGGSPGVPASAQIGTNGREPRASARGRGRYARPMRNHQVGLASILVAVAIAGVIVGY
ncbi:MAG: hypothetical protein ACJ789_02170, partial [Thermomicrobiales bacterium]